MTKTIEFIFLFLSILIISNGEPLKKILNKHRKLEVSANLNFIEAYDLIYENNKWSFKIKTDSELTNQANVLVDIFVLNRGSSIKSQETANCIYNKKILSCATSRNTLDNDLVTLSAVKFRGTVEWENLNLKEIKIPLNTTMTYTKSYGLFFANKWNFMIDAKTIVNTPHYSKAYIDILHNDVETTATCEILGDFKNYITNIACVSDYEIQTGNDIIKINTKKKYGSIEWSQKITDSQAEISEAEDSEISLQFIDAYDLFFDNNKWVFTIHSKSNQNQNPGKKYIVDIQYTRDGLDKSSKANCLLKEGMKSTSRILFICTCTYKNQNENDLIQIKYPKSGDSTVSWTTGISENYKIILKTSLTLVKAYNLEFSNVWSFKIDVANGILPKDSKIVIDAYDYDTPFTTNCTSIDNNCIFCETTKDSFNGHSISLSKEKSEIGSVIWNNNLQNDYKIYLNAKLAYRGAYNMVYNETDNKWYFVLKVVSPINRSKIKIDILYGEKLSTATCICNINEYNCVVDENNQNKKTLVKINKEQSETSTITWSSFESSDSIILSTDLTLSKPGILKINPKNNETWIFDLDIENEDIPENSMVIVDIFAYFCNDIMGNYIDQERRSTATCIYTYKKLNCEADSDYKGYEYTISLLLEKVEGSESSINSWKYDGDEGKKRVDFLIEITLNYHYCTNIKLVEEKYIFYCHFHKSTPMPRYSEGTIDILVEDEPSISYCTAVDFYNIKCEIKPEDYKPEKNFVSYKKTRKSTITFNYLNENQYLFPIELEFFQAYNSKEGILETLYPFNMLVKGDKLKEGLRFDVVINHTEKDNSHSFEENAPCEIYGGVAFCWWYNYNYKIDFVLDNYNLLLRSDGDNIKWKNPGSYNFMEDLWIRLKYIELISIEYNSVNERYEFSLKVEKDSEMDISQYSIVLDLFIDHGPKYGHCLINSDDNTIINCNTDKIKYKKARKIELLNRQYIGNVIWTGVNQNITLYGANYYNILSDKIYDLKFQDNKWTFIIKPLGIIPFEGTKQLDILINENQGLADCKINNDNLVVCEVNSDGIQNTDLIRLNTDNTNSETEIQMYYPENDGIPFNINLEFIQAYDLIFDNEKDNWFFKIKAIIENDISIPDGSTFSTGILYSGKEDVAFCSQEGNIENKIIILLCRPEYKVKKTVSISFSGANKPYSSIIWTNQIPEDDLGFINIAELDVIKVDNLKFDLSNNKWYFKMYVSDLSDTDLFLNSKVKIDLKYNNEDILGTCILKESEIFLCSPDYENQKDDDTIIISPTKKNGSVTFKNRKLKLKFAVKLTYEKYYDLKFINSIWEFKIKLSEIDIEDGDEITIDIIVDGLANYAGCTLNSNILSCQVKKDGQTMKNRIKLINNSQNTFLKWTNLPEIVDMYLISKISFINVYGGFHENKWKFNIHFVDKNEQKNIYDNYSLLDILVNSKESTAVCEITKYSFLKCVSNHKNQQKTDVVKIAGNTTPNLGTVYFEQNLNDEQKTINFLSLKIKYKSVESEIEDNKFKFTIKGSLNEEINYDIERDTITEIEIVSKNKKTEVVCLTNYISSDEEIVSVYLYCSTEVENIEDLEDVSINIDQNGLSKYIYFNSNNNIAIKEAEKEDIETEIPKDDTKTEIPKDDEQTTSPEEDKKGEKGIIEDNKVYLNKKFELLLFLLILIL